MTVAYCKDFTLLYINEKILVCKLYQNFGLIVESHVMTSVFT